MTEIMKMRYPAPNTNCVGLICLLFLSCVDLQIYLFFIRRKKKSRRGL